MLILAGYTIVQQIYEGTHTLVFRGVRDKDKTPVIIKLLKDEYPTAELLARFKHEFEILNSLQGNGTVNAYELISYDNTLAIIMESYGTGSIKDLLVDHVLDVKEFLIIAIAVTECLEIIHGQRIIHKDINPANILYDKNNQQIKIIDFGIATTLSREEPEIPNLHILEGMLPYISPEQTGRVNRGIDYRTDYYSLGVMLYQMITGKLPFEVTDPLALVHAHIAKTPVKPVTINNSIPNIISNIIMKLMAKNAEDRYQSTFGLKSDLLQVLNQLNLKGEINEFQLATHDISSRFIIPEKLYGREKESKIILEAFERGSTQSAEMVLVTGQPGIGKSRIIHELHKTILNKRGYFITGKFNNYKRNQPYASLIQAFQELIQQMLSEKSDEIEIWRERILKAVGSNGQVIIDVIPSLVEIIGPQPPLRTLGYTETENRFNLVFENFIQALALPDHPLAIFLDDLQWADIPSLKLLQTLLENIDSKYFLIICAYRDNEVDPSHPFISTVKSIRQSGVNVSEVYLKPLEITDIDNMISDLLHAPKETIRPLSSICFEKTHGNPFFLIQFLQKLYQENLIEFDVSKGSWNWNINQIQQKGFTDNVVVFMENKIRELPTLTQTILQLAACLGNRFDIKSLSIIAEQSTQQVSKDIWPALQAGLVIPLDDEYKYINDVDVDINAVFQFSHDRVHHAAYTLTKPDNLKSVHLKIGRLLLAHCDQTNLAEHVLDITNHLNTGIDLITNENEKTQLANLNLMSGKKAKLCIAYEQAYTFFQNGLHLLKNKNAWVDEYNLTLELYINAAETAALTKEFSQMEAFTDIIFKNAMNILDKAKAYHIRSNTYFGQGKLIESIRWGLEGLKLFGIKIPEHPRKIDVILSYLKSRFLLMNKNMENFSKQVDPHPENSEAILKLAIPIISAAYMMDPILMAMITMKGMNYIIKHGTLNAKSALWFMGYGAVVSAIFHDVDKGYQFGKLGFDVMRDSDDELKPMIDMIFYSIHAHLHQPVSNSLEPLKHSFHQALERGDLVAAGQAAFSYIATLLYVGKDLETTVKESQFYAHELLKLGVKNTYSYVKIIWYTALCILDRNEDEIKELEDFDELKLIDELTERKDNEGLCLVYTNKVFRLYINEEYEKAYELLPAAIHYADYVKGKEFLLLPALICLAYYPKAERSVQKILIPKIKKYMLTLKKYGIQSPSNFLHKYYLIAAEYFRLKEDYDAAEDLYDKATTTARKNGYLQDEAIANELAANFYFNRKSKRNMNYYIAKGYLNNSYYCYGRWGANAKLKRLEEHYQIFLNKDAKQKISSTSSTQHTTTTTSSDTTKDYLDLATILKAAQAISQELILSDVLKKMMKILIENTGAQVGYMLLEKDNKWLIQAEGSVDMEAEVQKSIPMEKKLPISIINYVIRTRKPLVIDDATHNSQFSQDPCIVRNKPVSIFCMPLLKQSALNGILYFENNVTVNAFTQDRVDVVNLLSAQIITSIENARLYDYMSDVNTAYRRFIPEEFLSLLNKSSITDIKLGDQVQKEMTVLVCDIRNFTTLSEKMSPRENIDFLNEFLANTGSEIMKHHGFIDKYIGDAIMALFPKEMHADNALSSAIALMRSLETYNKKRIDNSQSSIQVGIGINSGLLMLGTIGDKTRMEGTVISDAVNIAFRVENLTKFYGAPVLITENLYNKLKNPTFYCIRKMDTTFVKGKAKQVTLYEVFDTDSEDQITLKMQTLKKFEEAVNLCQEKQFDKALVLFQTIVQINPADFPATLYIKRCQEILAQSPLKKIENFTKKQVD